MKEYTKNLGKVVMTPKGAWSIEKEYEILDIVHDSITDHAYISKQEVPSGVDLSDSRYWMPLNVSGYSDSNVITLNSFNEDGEIQSYTLEEAIKTIKDIGRKSGAILIFYNNNVNRLDITTGCWEIWQFNSINVYDWENLDAWINIYYNYNKFVGWYAAENVLNKEIPNPDVGCYAFVGNIYNEAFVYRCDIKNQWTKTNQKAQHYIKVVFGNNVIIGDNGNWWQNGVDTNIPVSVKGDNGLTPYLRWSENNQIEYSYDNINWYSLSERFSTNIKIENYVNTIDNLPNNVELGTIYGVGPTYTEDDIEQTNPIYNLYVYTSNGWVNNGKFNSISAGIVQELGDSETEVMSQNAVTREINTLKAETNKKVAELETQFNGNFFTESGKYIDINGNDLTATGESITTDFLDLNNVESIKIKGRSGPYVALIAYYDENKRFISSIYGTEYSNVLISLTKDEFPTNAKYFRATGNGNENDVLIFDNFFRVEREIQEVSNSFNEITNVLNEETKQLDKDIYKLHGNFFTEEGKYIDPLGNLRTASNVSVATDYIPLANIETIKVRGRSGQYVSLIAYYDKNKTFISSLYGNSYNNVLVELTKEEFPSNAAYIRATGHGNDSDILEFASLFYILELSKQSKRIGLNAVATMGASLMYNGNGWVEQGCKIIGATPYNKAVSGERPPYFANKLYTDTYCTNEEFENIDVLVIQFSNIGNAYIENNTLSIEDYESMINTDLENPFKALNDAQCLDYILKKWQKKCYLQKDNVDSRWYGMEFGKPCNLLFVTHWHNARKSYNDSIRRVAEKWGGGVCEFDKHIGFSKEQPLYDGTQMSVIYAVDTEFIGDVEYGWHPLRGESGQMYIQKKMANIFAQCLIELNSMK